MTTNGWLTTAGIHSLPALEARALNEGVGGALLPLESAARPLSQMLEAAGGPGHPWLADASLQPLPSSPLGLLTQCVCVCVSGLLLLSLRRTPVIGSLPTQTHRDLISRSLTQLHLQRYHFQIRSHSQVPGIGRIFWEDMVQPITGA